MSGRKEAPLSVGGHSPNPLGEKVRMLRHQRGLSVTDLARAADLGAGGRGHISKIEHGHIRRVSNPLLAKLAHALHVSPVELITASFATAPSAASSSSFAAANHAPASPSAARTSGRTSGRTRARDHLVGQLLRRFRRWRPRSSPITRADQPYMTQLELAQAVSAVEQRQTGQKRSLGESYINKIERGGARLDQDQLCSMSLALKTTPEERAVLDEAAGFAGLLRYLANELHISIPPHLAALPTQVAEGGVSAEQMTAWLTGWVEQERATLATGNRCECAADRAADRAAVYATPPTDTPDASPLEWPLLLAASAALAEPGDAMPQREFRHDSCADESQRRSSTDSTMNPQYQLIQAATNVYNERTARATESETGGVDTLWAEVAVDEELQERCMRICRELWETYRKDVFTFLVLMVARRPVAERLLQTVFGGAFESSAFMSFMLDQATDNRDGGSPQSQAAVRSYLFMGVYQISIAYTMGAFAWRTGMSESGRSSDALYPSGAKPAADVEEDGEGDPDRVRVNQALQALPPLDRACLLLRFSRDFEPEQVAAIMDLECTVVDSLAESARKRFHAAMRRLEHGPASGRAQRPDPPNPPDAPHPLDSLDSLGRDGGTSLPLPSPLSKWELSRD